MAMMRPTDPLVGTLILSRTMTIATTDALLTAGTAREERMPSMLGKKSLSMSKLDFLLLGNTN